MPAPRPARNRTAGVLLPVLAVAWVVLVPVFAWQGFTTSLHFFGEQASEQEVRQAAQFWAYGILVAVVVPVIGLALARSTRSNAGTVVFLVLLAAGVVLAVAFGPGVYRELRPDPLPHPRVTTCQEHSGGDTRCPGG